MQTKQAILGLSLILVAITMTLPSAHADQVINGKFCDKWCLMDYSSKIAQEQMQNQHGYSYFFAHANYGWGFMSHSKLNPIGSH